MMEKHELDELRRRVVLSTLVGRRVKLRRNGPDWFGHCPFHDEKTGSFTVNDGKGFFHCFGCGAHGDVFAWFQHTERLNFPQAVERVRGEAGVDQINRDEDRQTAEKQAAARRIWTEAAPIGGTLAEIYLRQARRISITLPPTLRFHPALPFSRNHALTLPALVVAVTSEARQVVAVQRIYLKPDGSGKAELDAPKRSLGPIGKGAVRLGPAGIILGLAEGVETGLSAMEMYRLPVWCALGSNLSRVVLPDPVRQVVLFADRGKAGEAAAAQALEAFRKQRRKVSVRFPDVGDDFNDELAARRGR